MNFFFNKIDNDIRRKNYEKINNNKIHRKEEIKIYKDSEKNKEKTFDEYIQEEEKREKNKNNFTIKVTKLKKIDETSKIVLNGEKEENLNYKNYGNFIDTKK